VTPGLVIRRFEAADQAAARAVVLEGMFEHWGGLDPTLNLDLDDIADSYADAVFLVGHLDGPTDRRVVATGALRMRQGDGGGREGEIVRMAVASDARRRGIGQQMLRALTDEARRLGVRRIVLETTSDWHDIMTFYRRCGFTVTHEEQGRWSSNTWFALDL
jgi:GNAT superfamily N-acetyltransferase